MLPRCTGSRHTGVGEFLSIPDISRCRSVSLMCVYVCGGGGGRGTEGLTASCVMIKISSSTMEYCIPSYDLGHISDICSS